MNYRKQSEFSNFYYKSDIFFFVCGILMLCSEIWKQLTLTVAIGGGKYIWWYFPFQLCSIPMYILLVYPWLRRRNARLTLLAFLMSYSLLGGIAVFADTSGLHYPLRTLTIHSYTWHILLIILGVIAGFVYIRLLYSDNHRKCQKAHSGIVSGRQGLGQARTLARRLHKKKTLFSRTLTAAFPLRPFLYSTLLYLACCLTAVLLNLWLDRYGTINMFYINPDYEMQQIIFRNFIPIFGNNGVIALYIASTILGALIIFLIWKLIFRLRFHFRHSRLLP